MPTNSFPMAGAREFANRLIVNVYQQWIDCFTSRERDALCFFIARTIGRGEVSVRMTRNEAVTEILMVDITRDETLEQSVRTARTVVLMAELDAALANLRKVGVLFCVEQEGGMIEFMVNLRWKPQA